MATIKGTNVTKYDAGGSGDNNIGDGFIKTVEKVWIDTYSVAAVIPSSTSLLIARIPKNKKITDITVHMPVVGSPATNSTMYCCTGATTAITTFFGKLIPQGVQTAGTFDVGTACTLRISAVNSNIATALPADVGIYLMINPATTITGGTITTVVKYT